MLYFSDLVQQASDRAQEASLSVFGISNPQLRKHIKQQLNVPTGTGEALLAPPLFEHTFGWEPADKIMSELVGEKLLSNAILQSLDKDKIKVVKNKETKQAKNKYQFESHWSPYTHQLESWQTLLSDNVKSVVVTSGTGSGKTECFMIPVLEDLYREQQTVSQPLSGIRAIFLYPLNALINSQRERLDAYTQDFGENIRFCLYNGNTKHNKSEVSSKQKLHPNEVLSRELMREKPAPILVTNGTMLEYMLVRQVDAPIINISKQQKSLRWIVLDEAHTYVGSQAAELSLQLRRVLLAFGVEAKDVRFVATSATIAGDNAAKDLKVYLAELAGVSEDQVVVIGGQRVIPELPNCQNKELSLESLMEIPAAPVPENAKTKKKSDPDVSQMRYQALCDSPTATVIRDIFVNAKRPQTLEEINTQACQQLDRAKFTQQELLTWLDLLTATKPSEHQEAFLKVRSHFFQRMFNGLFSCIDPNCDHKNSSVLKGNWPFGFVYTKHRNHCECNSPVLEIAFCNECNEPHLLGLDKAGKLTQWNKDAGDEFSLLSETSDEYDDNSENKIITSPTQSQNKIVLSVKQDKADKKGNSFFSPIKIDVKTGHLHSNEAQAVNFFENFNTKQVCANCNYKGISSAPPYRRSILGAPFYVANVVPTVLEYCPDHVPEEGDKEGPKSLPGRGRKLITFTDSRQGTARMAVKMQQEAEQARLRGAVFEELRDKQLSLPEDPAVLSMKEQLREAEAANEQFLIDTFKNALAAMQESSAGKFKSVVITWAEMVVALSNKEDFQHSMLEANKYANPEVFGTNAGPFKLAETFLLREFIRRPKRYYNLETQGLVKVGYQGLDTIETIPERWATYGLDIQDWQDFIKIALDFYVRNNSFFRLEDEIRNWIGFKFKAKKLIKPDSQDESDNTHKKWPLLNITNPNRLFKLLILVTKLDEKASDTQDILNEWLRSAWLAVTSKKNPILKEESNSYFLDRSMLTFSFQDEYFSCPITNKLLDTTFKGITPYLPINYKDINVTCDKLKIGEVWVLDASTEDQANVSKKIRSLVKLDDNIQELRARNLWTDINDRTVEGGFYYRTAEHSAQQSADRLQDYEDKFKKGKVNVLNCSTTMEMGVDIGGISAVVMNNVPPHPANYLQRAGRAGRSKESRALAYTLCKSNPHDNQVFNNPAWPFTTVIAAPKVTLNSERLAQRHINAFLLGIFLTQEIGNTQKEKTSLSLSWFYEEGTETICDNFKGWVSTNSTQLSSAITTLIKGTALQNKAINVLLDTTASMIAKMQDDWVFELNRMEKEVLTAEVDGPYAFRLGMELGCHRKEYLLKELSAKAFLPGYGFPTDIVNLDNFNIEDFKRDKHAKKNKKEEREDNISRLRGLPSRNLSIAIREYAPGAEMVIDGRVFRSAGVSLNWQNIALADAKDAQKFDLAWRCDSCGQTGYETSIQIAEEELTCTSCPAVIKPEHKMKVLQPTGFVTDFYTSPTNDINSQKYIPVQPSWVSVASDKYPLPNPDTGFMMYGANGTVFHYSGGEHNKGYAVCLTCGRSESLDQHGEFPIALHPDKTHKPVRSSGKDKDKENGQFECEGSAHLQKDIFLGCHSKTDVLEVVLRNPVNHEYLYDTPENRNIALVIAVAARNALASRLGVLNNEMGYTIRPTHLNNGDNVIAIQIFDTISGGAGFASSGAEYIEDVLSDAIDNLHCDDQCDSICATCLLDSDTRHDADNLNRNNALAWLGEHFKKQVLLPTELSLIDDAKYVSLNAIQATQQIINKGASHIYIYLSDDANEWDLAANTFKQQLVHYVLQNDIGVTLVIPEQIQITGLTTSITADLLQLNAIGIELVQGNNQVASPTGTLGVIAAQIVSKTNVTTLATTHIECLHPSQQWFHSSDNSCLVKSETHPAVITKAVDVSQWQKVDNNKQVAVELTNQCNGQIKEFGYLFWQQIGAQAPALAEALKEENLDCIHYTDRYLQSPWSMLLLGELIREISNEQEPKFVIDTLFNAKNSTGKIISHDWDEQTEMAEVYEHWFKLGVETQCSINVLANRKLIPHRRELKLTFNSGKQFSIRFDQGVGYWNHDLTYNQRSFNFFSTEEQLTQLVNVWKNGKVKNDYSWSTDVYVTELT